MWYTCCASCGQITRNEPHLVCWCVSAGPHPQCLMKLHNKDCVLHFVLFANFYILKKSCYSIVCLPWMNDLDIGTIKCLWSDGILELKLNNVMRIECPTLNEHLRIMCGCPHCKFAHCCVMLSVCQYFWGTYPLSSCGHVGDQNAVAICSFTSFWGCDFRTHTAAGLSTQSAWGCMPHCPC